MSKATISPDMVKKFGKQAFISGSELKSTKSSRVSISPVLDVLTGGIPGGSNVVLSGDPKCGKTLTSLQIAANAQKLGRPVYFFNIEGRIKRRDLEGIKGLNLEDMKIVRSYKDEETGETKIMMAEEFLENAESIMHNSPGAVLIFDSVSMLVTSKEYDAELTDVHIAPGPVLMSKFLKRMSNVISVNDIIAISILHLIANPGYGKNKVKSGGRKVLYSGDVDIECKRFSFNTDKSGKPIGQEVEWITNATATVGPGQKATSTIRYGIGIDQIDELISLAVSIGYITRKGAWYTLSFLEDLVEDWGDGKKYQFQGKDKVYEYLDSNPADFDLLYKNTMELLMP